MEAAPAAAVVGSTDVLLGQAEVPRRVLLGLPRRVLLGQAEVAEVPSALAPR